jgi:hypothetical protein
VTFPGEVKIKMGGTSTTHFYFEFNIVLNYFTLLLFAGVRGTIIIANKRATSNTVIMTFLIN